MPRKRVKQLKKPGGKADWVALRNEYVTGNASYRGLAEMAGVSFNTLKQHASNEGWNEERKNYREEITQKTQRKAAERMSTTRADQLSKLRVAADSMADVITQVFDDAVQFKRHLITNGVGNGCTRTDCRIEEKVDTKAIRDLTSALKDITLVMRNLYDLPTMQEQSAMDIALERLTMDKRKADEGEGSHEVVVRFEGEGAERGAE